MHLFEIFNCLTNQPSFSQNVCQVSVGPYRHLCSYTCTEFEAGELNP